MIPPKPWKRGTRSTVDLVATRATVQWRVFGRPVAPDMRVKYVIETRVSEEDKWHEDHFTLWDEAAAMTRDRAIERGYVSENEVVE